jgi:hypothetical protein
LCHWLFECQFTCSKLTMVAWESEHPWFKWYDLYVILVRQCQTKLAILYTFIF